MSLFAVHTCYYCGHVCLEFKMVAVDPDTNRNHPIHVKCADEMRAKGYANDE